MLVDKKAVLFLWVRLVLAWMYNNLVGVVIVGC